MEKPSGGEDVELQKIADALRSFASRLSTQVGAAAHHNTICTPAAAAADDDDGVEVLADENFCFSVPCLQLRSSTRSVRIQSRSSSLSPLETLEEASAQSLGQMIHATRRDELSNLPSRLLTNCLASFCRLLEARCKQCIQALIGSTRHCDSCSEAAFVARLLAKLVTQNQPEAATINYKTLDFAERCNSPCRNNSTIGNIEQSGTGADIEDSKRASCHSSVVVPVILEVVVQWNLWENAAVISSEPLVAPGVLQGGEAFSDCSRTVLRTIRMEIDTKALLHSMMQQAKLIVRKALVAATCLVRQSRPSRPFRSPANVIPAGLMAGSKSSDSMQQQPNNVQEKRKRQEQESPHQYPMMPPPPKRAPNGEGQDFTNANTNSAREAGAPALPDAKSSMVSRKQTASTGEGKKHSDSVPALALLTEAIKPLEET